jgi:hypothetical protein
MRKQKFWSWKFRTAFHSDYFGAVQVPTVAFWRVDTSPRPTE